MRRLKFELSLFLVLLVGCSTNIAIPATPCAVVPPDQTLVKKELVIAVRADLESFANTRATAASQLELNRQANEIYQKLGDKDVACSMLLRTSICLTQNGASASRITEFQAYLKDTQACERVEDAKLSIDNLLQTAVGQESLLYRYSVQLDVITRNSSDKPININSVTTTFDEHLRPPRSPDNMQAVTAIYTVAVDARGATVKGAELTSPAKAFYPNPGSPVLQVITPIAQSLGPRSTDRFRIKYIFNEDMEFRGPREKVRVEVNYNDGIAVGSKLIDLIQMEPCVKVNGELVCRDGKVHKL